MTSRPLNNSNAIPVLRDATEVQPPDKSEVLRAKPEQLGTATADSDHIDDLGSAKNNPSAERWG